MALCGTCSKIRAALCEGLCIRPGILGYYFDPTLLHFT